VKQPVIALITDFGEDDFFVASLKAVILKISPSARIVDITHQIPSFDIMRGSFVLYSCLKYFPKGTIFLAVIDPGVGSDRKILLAKTKDYFFIAPDNGVLSFVFLSERIEQVRSITNEKYFLENPSRTFEGRDKMAPVAAWLSRGISLDEFGPRQETFNFISNISPLHKKDRITGSIIHVDKFGNLITNITDQMLVRFAGKSGGKAVFLHVKGREVIDFRKNYSQGKDGDVFFLVGSVGFLEVAAKKDSASRILDAHAGDKVELLKKPE